MSTCDGEIGGEKKIKKVYGSLDRGDEKIVRKNEIISLDFFFIFT